MAFKAKILADSLSPDHVRLTTFEVTFPRFILAEVNTHRILSRNSASSRAIPLEKQITKLQNDPFIPKQWPIEQKGMSGGGPLQGEKELLSRDTWVSAREQAIQSAKKLAKLGVHKSLCNRLLEPFMWHTAIITGTEWSNFFALRTDENAQPEFRTIALMMRDLYQTEEPIPLDYNERHLPLVSAAEREAEAMGYSDPKEIFEDWAMWTKVSAGRCCRVSYLTHDGKRDLQADIDLHDRLLGNGHMSPLEHQARPRDIKARVEKDRWSGNFYGWNQYRKTIFNEHDFGEILKLAVA